MNRRTQRTSPHAVASAVALVALVLVVLASGCSTDQRDIICENCEDWDQITAGLGRFPAPHPVDPDVVAYSTVTKSLGSPDMNKEADEDLWLAWKDETQARGYREFQLTGDHTAADSAIAVGDNLGDNFSPRWNPSGTQLAFLHTSQTGTFELWRMAVTMMGSGLPILGPPELVVRGARDPAWQSDTQIFFTRSDKIYRIEVPLGSGPPVGPAVQVTYNPPTYASSEDFLDRHPDFSPDGAGVFDTQGRRNVARLLVEAFEIDATVVPPDTFPTTSYIAFFPPGATVPSYPIFESPDTLTTPVLLNSIPVDEGGDFIIGVRRDFRFLADSLADTYCDTTLTKTVRLVPGDADTVSFYFKTARGGLRITSGITGTVVFWRRADARVTVADFPGNPLLNDLGEVLSYECLLSYALDQSGAIREDSLETYIVTGSKLTKRDSVRVTLPPGEVVPVHLFPTGTIRGTLAFSDRPAPPYPRVSVTAFDAGTSNAFTLSFSDTTGVYRIARLPAGAYDLFFELSGYVSQLVPGIVVTPPDTTLVPLVTLDPDPVPGPATQAPPSTRRGPEPTTTRGEPVVRTLRRENTWVDHPGSLRSLFRAPGDVSTLWRIDTEDLQQPRFAEIFGSDGVIQNPAVTDDLGGGERFVAYVSNESGSWELYVRRLVNWVPSSSSVRIATPGSFDNLSCSRSTFHPRWAPGRAGSGMRLYVAMTDCPDNGFEELGTDDDPWALGELRIWSVDLHAGDL